MTVRRVAIIGAGTMGGGIAIGCLTAGMATVVIDTTEAALIDLTRRVGGHFDRAVAKGRLPAEAAEAARANLRTAIDPASASGAELVIEAVFEDLSVKRDLFARLVPALAPEVVIATNTSALRVADLAEAVPHPQRFLGLHYFSPAEINPLVEVVRGPSTGELAIELVLDFLHRTGKTPLPCRDANGFAVNRFFCPYTNEAVRCFDEGLGTTTTIDRIARESFGLPLGPFAVMNIIKPRINLNAIRNLSPLGAFYRPADSMTKVGEAGESWTFDESESEPDEARRKEIADRLRAALMFPVLEAIGEEVAEPEAFDTGARLALRFGKPPVALMRELGRDRVTALLQPLAARHAAAMPTRGLDAVFPA